MPPRRLTLPAVATLTLACLLLGALAAFADGAGGGRKMPTPVKYARAAPAYPGPPALVVAAPARGCEAGPRARKAPAAEPVPQNLLDAFGVLRRARTDADTLPGTALKALRARGLEPFDPAAARLLRTSAGGGRAWVVPVRDVQAQLLPFIRCSLPATRPARPRALKFARPATPVPPPATPAPRPVPPPSTRPVPGPPATLVEPAPAPAPKPDSTPHPGLAVVAVDGAPSGAGGRLEHLVRGREPVSIQPCAGPNKDMLSVSGIVPDGVPATFLTSPDGTAVRADVHDNAYTFIIPSTKIREQRYVVWTGGDGTPHVQPLLPGFPFLLPARCSTTARYPTISPDLFTPTLTAPLLPPRLVVPKRRG
jgi:hypothetical protein